MDLARSHKAAVISMIWTVVAIVTVLGSSEAGTLYSQRELYLSPIGDTWERLMKLAAAAGPVLALVGVVLAGRAVSKGDRLGWAVLPIAVLALGYALIGFFIFDLFTF